MRNDGQEKKGKQSRGKWGRIALGLAALVGLLFAVVAPSSAAQTQCTDVYRWYKRNGKPVITNFSVNICYNGSRVWTTRVECPLVAIGGTAKNTWCGTAVNNSSYVEFGNNYTFEAGGPFGPLLQLPGYNRVRYNANGNFIGENGN